jgi:hypothetical protein
MKAQAKQVASTNSIDASRRSRIASKSKKPKCRQTFLDNEIRATTRRFNPSKRLTVLVRFATVLGVVGIVGAGTSGAFWTSVGGGDGAAGVGSLQPVTVKSISIPAGRLSPDGPPVPVSITLHNANSFPLTITNITAAEFTSNVPGCGDINNPTGVDLDFDPTTFPTFVGDQVVVAQASMGLNSASTCQDATFSTVLTVEARR